MYAKRHNFFFRSQIQVLRWATIKKLDLISEFFSFLSKCSCTQLIRGSFLGFGCLRPFWGQKVCKLPQFFSCFQIQDLEWPTVKELDFINKFCSYLRRYPPIFDQVLRWAIIKKLDLISEFFSFFKQIFLCPTD